MKKGVGSISQRYGWIRNKMSRIPNIGYFIYWLFSDQRNSLVTEMHSNNGFLSFCLNQFFKNLDSYQEERQDSDRVCGFFAERYSIHRSSKSWKLNWLVRVLKYFSDSFMNLYAISSVAKPGCLSRSRTRIMFPPGSNNSNKRGGGKICSTFFVATSIKNLKTILFLLFSKKIVTKLSKTWVWDGGGGGRHRIRIRIRHTGNYAQFSLSICVIRKRWVR